MKQIRINTEKTTGSVSPWLRGACMEDVNHELYGGIWSQMIFGESFAEPAESGMDRERLTVLGATWDIDGNRVSCGREGSGPKLVFRDTEMQNCTVSAKIHLGGNGLAGFTARVSDAKNGADAFTGYEIAVGGGIVRLARHRNNFVLLQDVPVPVGEGDTVVLSASLEGGRIRVSVDGTEYIDFTDDDPILSGKLGLRCWQTAAEITDITIDGVPVAIPQKKILPQVSKMWLPLGGDADSCGFGDSFRNCHSQTLRADGSETGVYNRGLNKSGMYFAADKPYRGYLYIRAEKETDVTVSLRNSDCTAVHADNTFKASGDWAKYAFTLTSPTEEIDGSFAVTIENGEIALGYAFLEPDEWGLYKGMHVRRDVGEGLENMGISILRFGGCMANAREYLWKKMTGEPEFRPVYKGFWYPESSFGFGILEFIELCEKLGVECVPDFNGYETEEDMRDFARYALGTDENDEWVQLRMKSAHPQPYKLKFIQFGNEERVDEDFADRFIAACRGVWSVNPEIIMALGDFEYKKITEDPYRLPENSNASGITTLHPHERILQFAKDSGQAGKVYIDIHWWSEHGDSPLPFPAAAWSLYENLEKLVPESGVKLCVYELNANAHDMERAAANAYAILEAIRHSEILPYMCSANCLQVDKHNDNNWDQGLLFMNNRSVWYQAPGLLNLLLEKAWLPEKLAFNEDIIDARFNAAVMTDGEKISVFLLNRSDAEEDAEILLSGRGGRIPYCVTMLNAAKDAVNTAENPSRITVSDSVSGEGDGRVTVKLPPYSIAAVEL
ncbi:MAG: hypothetical protein IJF78_02370 [Clostridia bacterium]|nr:hypothetical protein [Clostridia bacterium]